MLEKNGVHIAAVSYDSQEILLGFADQYGIGFPLLSDQDSSVIRRFGIFNTNIASGLRAHGVPHPVDYLVAPDGMVIRKYFVENYQHRVTASAVVLKEFGSVGKDASAITLQDGALTVKIGLSGAKAFAGQEIAFFAKFQLEPGWHIYGAEVVFDDPNIIRQSFTLGETLPEYSDSFEGRGSLLLKFPINAGEVLLSGQIRFQQCSETVCEAPQALPFQLPLTIEPFMIPASRK
jgi:hypothetical protein